MVVLATYSDGSKSVVTDYTYSTDPLTTGTTCIDIRYGGQWRHKPLQCPRSPVGRNITANPTNLVYAADETFDPAEWS
jgi:hypothetical protein